MSKQKKELEELDALSADYALNHEDELEDYEVYDDLFDDKEDYDFSKPESSAGSWTSLILGIISSLGWIVPVIGLPVTIVGTVLGAINIKSRKSRGVAIAGFVINIVFLCASIAKWIVDIVIHARNKKA